MKIFIYILLIALATNTASATTFHVGKAYPDHAIQPVADRCKAGDTIWVSPGIYHEKNLVIRKAIVLIGIGYPVLDGEGKYEVVSVRTNNATIDGFKVINSAASVLKDPAGIKIYDARGVQVINNILENNFFGIYSQFGTACIIRNNHITTHAISEQSIGNGIHCWKSDSLQITGNTIKGYRDGIYFEFVTHTNIEKNHSEGNIRYGLHFMFSNEDTYTHNVFKGNGAGVAVMYTHGVRMYNNSFEENWGDAAYGLLLKEISDSYIEGNKFTGNTTGIYMDGTSRIRMQHNEWKDNGWAMRIQANCMDITVTQNNFIRNSFDVATNGSLVLNTFDQNYWDKYDGYDINHNNLGDVPYRPVSLFSMIVEKIPTTMMLFRSIITTLLDKSEKILPGITPENLVDNKPLMKPMNL